MLVSLMLRSSSCFRTEFLHPWLTFGWLRPLHTNAVIFAFVGNGIFMGAITLQRLVKARMASNFPQLVNFWELAVHHRAGGHHPATWPDQFFRVC